MAWTQIKTISLSSSWQYTNPVEGEFFRLKHTGAPAGGLFAIAQAEFNEDNTVNLADVLSLEQGRELDLVRLPKPESFTNRRIAIKRLSQSPSLESELRRLLKSTLFESQLISLRRSGSAWSVAIESSDYASEQIAEQFNTINQKLAEIEAKIDNINASSSATDSHFSNVSLLLHFDGANNSQAFVNVKSKSITAIGDAKISTAQSKFGGSSAYFDGSGDCLEVVGGLTPLGTRDFTLEGWLYLPASNDFSLFGQWNSSGFDSSNYAFAITNGKLVFYQRSISDSTFVLATSTALLVNNWYHLAATRSGNIFRLFVNGTKEAEGSFGVSIGSTASPSYIMYGSIGAVTSNAYLDDFRLTEEIARYTADFIAPTTAFPNS